MDKHQAQIRAKYATACNIAKSDGRTKPDWEQFKQQYNYYGRTTIINNPDQTSHRSTTKAIKDNARRQEKTVKQINITVKNLVQQFDILDDFFHDISERHPEYKTYHKLSDYIYNSLNDISEKLQTLQRCKRGNIKNHFIRFSNNCGIIIYNIILRNEVSKNECKEIKST